MTSETLVVVASAALSLALAYIPFLKNKYEPLPKEAKASIMGALLIGTTFVIYGLACANLLNLFGLTVACTAQGAAELAKLLFLALVANQATFTLMVDPYNRKSPEPQATT